MIGDDLRQLAEDWDFYESIPDAETRRSMQRALAVELSAVLDRMRAVCAKPAAAAERRVARVRRRSR